MAQNFLAVVGLGNPGARYDSTRHNIGFAVVDALRACSGLRDPSDTLGEAQSKAEAALMGRLAEHGWSDKGEHFESPLALGDWSATLIKPMTFMNRSGEPLQKVLHFRKISLPHVVVIHDEIDIPFGSIRIKQDGGEGGHNGLRSISEMCGGRGYTRVRVGVGKPPAGSPLAQQPDGVATWVLGKFSQEERPFAEELVARAAEAVMLLGVKGLKAAQNKVNQS